jgi:hypothetical protein
LLHFFYDIFKLPGDDSETLLICTAGGSQTAQWRKQYQQHNIIIEDFIPFEDVMPYADVYISNGGYGGVLLGVPKGIQNLFFFQKVKGTKGKFRAFYGFGPGGLTK